MAYYDTRTETTTDFARTGALDKLLAALDRYPHRADRKDWRDKLKANLQTIYEYNGYADLPGNQLAIINEEGETIIADARPACKQAVLDKLIELSRIHPHWEHRITADEISKIREVVESETKIAEAQRDEPCIAEPSIPLGGAEGVISASLEAVMAVPPSQPADALARASSQISFAAIASQASIPDEAAAHRAPTPATVAASSIGSFPPGTLAAVFHEVATGGKPAVTERSNDRSS